jgi:hypothetical protein
MIQSGFTNVSLRSSMKVGDLVRFKITALRDNHTAWLKDCAKSRVPMLILNEYDPEGPSAFDVHIEAYLLGERVFEVMCEDVSFHAFECELVKQ